MLYAITGRQLARQRADLPDDDAGFYELMRRYLALHIPLARSHCSSVDAVRARPSDLSVAALQVVGGALAIAVAITLGARRGQTQDCSRIDRGQRQLAAVVALLLLVDR